jgi:hypothetical protein
VVVSCPNGGIPMYSRHRSRITRTCFAALCGLLLLPIAGPTAAQARASVTTRASSSNRCLSFKQNASSWAADPRDTVVLHASAEAPSATLKKLSLRASATIVCAAPPPASGSIVSDGRPETVQTIDFTPTTTDAQNGAASLSVAMKVDLQKYARRCSEQGLAPFERITVQWNATAEDAQGLAAASNSTVIDASCPGGGNGCLDAAAPSAPKCGSRTCGCGQVCCSEVENAEDMCMPRAECEHLRRIHDDTRHAPRQPD